jgi:hypothetical protein
LLCKAISEGMVSLLKTFIIVWSETALNLFMPIGQYTDSLRNVDDSTQVLDRA